jgi:hypothetical protein
MAIVVVPNPNPAPPINAPTFSTQLWSEEVGLMGEPVSEGPGYIFSGGRTFARTPYDPVAPVELPPIPLT